MRWAWMLGWLLGQLLVGLLLTPLPARACRCVARHQTFAEEATAARLVFSGRVVARQEARAGQLGQLRFELQPGTVWKGPTATRYVIYSDQSSCGVDFRPSQDYLFVIHDYPGFRPDSLHLGRCGGYHAPLAEARVLGLVKALFVPTLRVNLGAAGPRLNASEAEYFAGTLPGTGFDFTNQTLGIFVNRRRITKQHYFARYLTADVVNQLVVFTPAERAAAGGYAAAVVLERRKALAPAFRRRLVRQLAKVPPG